jgi:hypothetical protein
LAVGHDAPVGSRCCAPGGTAPFNNQQGIVERSSIAFSPLGVAPVATPAVRAAIAAAAIVAAAALFVFAPFAAPSPFPFASRHAHTPLLNTVQGIVE